MKNSRTKFIAIIIMLFVIAVTPACEAFWQAMQDSSTTQVDDDDTEKNGETNTSKGKGQN